MNYDRNGKEDFIVVACDGIWDVIDNAGVCERIKYELVFWIISVGMRGEVRRCCWKYNRLLLRRGKQGQYEHNYSFIWKK